MKDPIRWNRVLQGVKRKLYKAREEKNKVRFDWLCHLGNRLFIYRGNDKAVMASDELWRRL